MAYSQKCSFSTEFCKVNQQLRKRKKTIKTSQWETVVDNHWHKNSTKVNTHWKHSFFSTVSRCEWLQRQVQLKDESTGTDKAQSFIFFFFFSFHTMWLNKSNSLWSTVLDEHLPVWKCQSQPFKSVLKAIKCSAQSGLKHETKKPAGFPNQTPLQTIFQLINILSNP